MTPSHLDPGTLEEFLRDGGEVDLRRNGRLWGCEECADCWNPSFLLMKRSGRWVCENVWAAEAREIAYQITEAVETPWDVARRDAYKQLDNLLLEGLAEQAAGNGAKMAAYLTMRDAIKQMYPKPEDQPQDPVEGGSP